MDFNDVKGMLVNMAVRIRPSFEKVLGRSDGRWMAGWMSCMGFWRLFEGCLMDKLEEGRMDC